MPAGKTISLTLVAFVAQGALAGNSRGSMVEALGSDIAPGLRPKSDKKFFGKDYPEDLRPEVAHRFDHPYPTVQDDSDYDRDFVEDENHDSGEWTAQFEYDALKTRLQREKAEMMRAKAKMEEEKREYEAIAGKEADAERETEALEERAEKAADEEAESEGKSEGGAQHAGEAKDVEEESEDLRKCEDELRAAKEELKGLLEQVKAADRASGEAADTADAAEADSMAAEKDEGTWEDKVSRLDKLHKLILEKYEAKLGELKKLEAKLSKAAQHLAEVRQPQMDSKGAIVQDSKSADPVAFHSGSARMSGRQVFALASGTLLLWALS